MTEPRDATVEAARKTVCEWQATLGDNAVHLDATQGGSLLEAITAHTEAALEHERAGHPHHEACSKCLDKREGWRKRAEKAEAAVKGKDEEIMRLTKEVERLSKPITGWPRGPAYFD